MDPISIGLGILMVGCFLRYMAEEGWAAVNGRPSPRLARRRDRHEIAEKQRADLGRPTIGQALTGWLVAILGRIAGRIVDPPPPGPLRRLVAEVWEDSWVDVTDWHRAKRERRRRREEQGPDVETVVLDRHECACGRTIYGELERCAACQLAHDRQEQAAPPADHCQMCEHTGIIAVADCACPNVPGGCACAVYWARMNRPPHDVVDAEPAPEPVRPTECIYCGVNPVVFPELHCDDCVRPRPAPDPESTEPTDQPDPEPTPAPVPDRKDPTVAPTINGDTVSPLENLGWADASRAMNADIGQRLGTIADNLAGAGCGHDFVQVVHDIRQAAERFDAATAEAQEVYARHVHHQAELAGDPDLARTVDGTYLSSATA